MNNVDFQKLHNANASSAELSMKEKPRSCVDSDSLDASDVFATSATNPHKTSPVAFNMNEQAIALGTVTLPADEAAPRLGFEGKRGLERFRGLCKAGKIPAFFDGKSYRLHWPSVTKALFGGGK